MSKYRIQVEVETSPEAASYIADLFESTLVLAGYVEPEILVIPIDD